ncbi:hypothetical protein BME96_11855 [Virgibacillus halodenitrificans]|uniref:Lipoprotein n=1 Tax=Virgibacillus halodenitrificans TaxID=1482 RepID=A0AAC9J330_VIRHA|nr:hypothetical protein [Virgibacillus halodenitrificans]APC48845.1 hypothetical protein BME96_11855 [Virgibacillus halodenitrificans]
MKRILLFLSLCLFVLLVGCTNGQDEEADKEKSDEKSVSLQEQIENLMNANKFKYDKIVDLDIIDDFIYSVSLNHNGGLDLAIMNYNNGTLKWIVGDNSATILQDKGSRYMYVIESEDPDVEQVNVLGEPAKAVTYYDEKTEDYTRKIKYWVAYTEEEPAPSDLEYIKK